MSTEGPPSYRLDVDVFSGKGIFRIKNAMHLWFAWEYYHWPIWTNVWRRGYTEFKIFYCILSIGKKLSFLKLTHQWLLSFFKEDQLLFIWESQNFIVFSVIVVEANFYNACPPNLSRFSGHIAWAGTTANVATYMIQEWISLSNYNLHDLCSICYHPSTLFSNCLMMNLREVGCLISIPA